MKTDNFIKGRYLAELTKGFLFLFFIYFFLFIYNFNQNFNFKKIEVLGDLEDSKYQMAEYRISIYGK